MPDTTAHARPCVGDLARLLLGVGARTTLLTVLLLALWPAVPAALGWHVTTVVSGSMAPAVRAGDLVAAMPVDGGSVQPGQVLLVDDPDHRDRQRLHRLVRVEADGALRLRGDANPAADRSTVDPPAVLGVGVLRFPGVGLPSLWVRDGDWTSTAIAAVTVVALALLGRADRDLRAGRPCRRCGAPRWSLDTAVAPSAGTGPAVPVIAVLAVVTAGAVGLAGSGFTADAVRTAAFASTSFQCFHGETDGAVLAWDFAEKTGPRVTDVSGHGQDGEFMTRSPSRVDGSCSDNPYSTYRADDLGSYAVSDDRTAAPNVFSLELWFRLRPGDAGRVFGFSSDRIVESPFRDRLFYVDADGCLRFGGEQSGSGWKFTVVTEPVDDGLWHHAVGSYEAGELRLSLDGELVGTRSDAGTLRQYEGYWRTGRGSLGGWPNTGEYGYTGDIDTVRVHDRVLDAAEIRAHFRAGR